MAFPRLPGSTLAFAVFLCLVIGPISVSAKPRDFAGRVQAILDEERAKWGNPGISAAVVEIGEPVFLAVSGFADRESKLPMTPETQLAAASISKLFTGILVMQEVEKGRLHLDQPVNSYLSEPFWVRDEKQNPVDVTLRQLLSHHSGLPIAWGGIVRRGSPVPTLRERLSQGQTIVAQPGTVVIYANDGFSLAGFVAAGADKGDFPKAVQSQIFEPLGMSDSTWQSPWDLKTGRLAAAYGGLTGGSDRAEYMDVTSTGPAGSLITTAGDLARFAEMLLRGGEYHGRQIIKKESLNEMWTLRVRTHPSMRTGFGVAFGVRETPGHKRVWWDGGLPGAAGRFMLIPSHNVGVVVLSNMSENAASAEAANRILEILVPEPKLPGYSPPADELAKLAGAYRIENSVDPSLWFLRYAMNISFSVRDGALWHDSRMTKSGPLQPIGPRRFLIRGGMFDQAEVYFEDDQVFIGYIHARRIPFYSNIGAFCTYGVLVLIGLTAGVVLFIRRRRHRDSVR